MILIEVMTLIVLLTWVLNSKEVKVPQVTYSKVGVLI
jgi:hypothetical protein